MKGKINIKEGNLSYRQSVYAQEITLHFKTPISINEIKIKLSDFLFDVVTFLRNNGCKLIGHVKALLDVENDGCLFFSMTSFKRRANCKGTIIKEIEVAKLKINIVVYGNRPLNIKKALNKTLTKHFYKETL